MFRGSSFHTIDPKGRIIIPSRFREVIKKDGADGVMVTGWDRCLFAYAYNQWGELEQKVLHSPEKGDELRRFQRIFIGGAHDCKCDAQGRILIPPALKQYARLDKEIVLVGVLYRFEIWSRDAWDQEQGLMQEDLGDNRVRQEIAQLGI